MTAPTLSDLDTELLEAIALPCEAKELTADGRAVEGCDRPAEWVIRTVCHCGHVEIDLVCDRHYGLFGSPGHRFMCSACLCIGRFTDRQAERL